MRSGMTMVMTLALVGSVACASTNATSASTARSGSQSARSPDLISAQEIAATSAGNAYDLIVRLRPQWLRTSGVSSIGTGARQGAIVAYVDNIRLSGVDQLRGISAESVTSIRYLNAEQAASRFPDSSAGLVSGALVVSTR